MIRDPVDVVHYQQRRLAEGEENPGKPDSGKSLVYQTLLVCLELNQRAAVPVLSDFFLTDRGGFCMATTKCQAMFGRSHNVVPRTCLWFLRSSSCRCTCWSLIAHVCHFFHPVFPNRSSTTIFLSLKFHFISWMNIWESVKWSSALFEWSSREKRGSL